MNVCGSVDEVSHVLSPKLDRTIRKIETKTNINEPPLAIGRRKSGARDDGVRFLGLVGSMLRQRLRSPYQVWWNIFGPEDILYTNDEVT